jgi:hypothetical protein
VVRCQYGKLHTPAGEEGIIPGEKDIGSLACERCEGRIDLVAGAGLI